MANKIQFRRDTAANWTSVNPTISQGELGYETDTTKYKIGDGTTAWTSLAYNTSYSDADVDTHLNKSTAATGEVLSWSGTDYDWIAAGGGSPTLYAESLSGATSPTATGTNSVAIGSDAQATATNGSIAFGTATRASGNANAAIGYQANAAGVGALATGYLANAAADFSTAVGRNAKTATGSNATALTNSYASGTDSFAAAIANNTSTYGATGANSIAIGAGLARATSSRAMAFGNNAIASGADSVAIGRSTDATASASFGFGYAVLASHANSLVFGTSASSSAINQITLGSTSDTVRISSAYTLPTADGTANQVLTTDGAGAVTFATAGGGGGADLYAANESSPTAQPSATGANAVAIGDRSSASGSRGIAIGGYGALASGASSLAFGYQATANQSYASGFGYASKAYGQYSWAGTQSHASGLSSVALGIGDTTTTYGAQHTSGVAIGYQAVTTADKQIALGSSTAQVKVSGTYTLLALMRWPLVLGQSPAVRSVLLLDHLVPTLRFHLAHSQSAWVLTLVPMAVRL